MDSLHGQLLIAPAYLSDPNFSRAVVVVFQHDDDGALGVILNRPSSRSIRELWAQVEGWECASDQEVYWGGPVTGPLVALHGDPDCSEVPVVPGVFCTMRVGHLERLVTGEHPSVRFFAGYAGWGAGQLEAELSTGSWLTMTADTDHVFETPAIELWARATREASGLGRRPPLDFVGRLDDPAVN